MHQFLAFATRLERSRACCGVIMLDIDNVQALSHSPFNGSIDVADDVPIVLGDVVLNVDNDKCFVIHPN